MKKLYENNLLVEHSGGRAASDETRLGILPVFVGADDPQSALAKAVRAATNEGMKFIDLEGNVREIPHENWEEYIGKVWPEAIARLPSQTQLRHVISEGLVFFGPFIAVTAPN